MGRSQYGAWGMQIWLTAACPKTLIVTLGDMLESGNAKNRVNLARFVRARCGVSYILRVVYVCAYVSEVCRCACPEVRIHALKFMEHGPLDSL